MREPIELTSSTWFSNAALFMLKLFTSSFEVHVHGIKYKNVNLQNSETINVNFYIFSAFCYALLRMFYGTMFNNRKFYQSFLVPFWHFDHVGRNNWITASKTRDKPFYIFWKWCKVGDIRALNGIFLSCVKKCSAMPSLNTNA